jgi:hypothetical protein
MQISLDSLEIKGISWRLIVIYSDLMDYIMVTLW